MCIRDRYNRNINPGSNPVFFGGAFRFRFRFHVYLQSLFPTLFFHDPDGQENKERGQAYKVYEMAQREDTLGHLRIFLAQGQPVQDIGDERTGDELNKALGKIQEKQRAEGCDGRDDLAVGERRNEQTHADEQGAVEQQAQNPADDRDKRDGRVKIYETGENQSRRCV